MLPILRALGQKPNQVVVRSPGSRFLSAPMPIEPYALEHWQYAWLSVAAYGQTPAGRKEIERRRLHPSRLAQVIANPGPVLEAAGWSQWDDFPDRGLQQKIRDTHLRVEVWQKRALPEGGARATVVIAVIFGGTVFDNEQDWRANLRWFLPRWLFAGGLDQYSAIVQDVAPAFVEKFKERVSAGEALGATVVATGHSLGGGLAQQFAYALPEDRAVPRVTQVYAFDPSPVTGFYSVPRLLRNSNKRTLKTDRIYERGEVLALLRSLTSLFVRPSKEHPAIRGVRYCLFYGWNPIADHSILRLARKLEAAIDPAISANGRCV